MRHSQAQRFLEAFDRAELSEATRQELDNHLEGCADCASVASSMSNMSDFVRLAASEPLPEAFDAALTTVRTRTLVAIREGRTAATGFGASLGWLARLGWAPLAVPATVAAGLVIAVLVQQPATGRGPLRAQAQGETYLIASTAEPQDFRLLREGSEVRIEFAKNGGRNHKVRKASDPLGAKVANGETVQGKSWSEPAAVPAPGSVTFYVID